MDQPASLNGYSLVEIVDHVRHFAGMTGKAPISAIAEFVDTSDPVHGPGDDGAVVEVGDEKIVACGEALSPPFVQGDPYGAGIAAVLANVNDVAAMGGIPLGIVNTLVGPAETTHEAMRGMIAGSEMYDVPIIGGHLTEREGETSLSAFAVGSATGVLSMANIKSGQTLLFACFLDGRMRPDFPFFTSIDQQANRFAADVRVLHEVGASGAAVAAKDVSMAGALGSLAMLLEFRGLGATIDLAALPTPEDTDFLKWLICFPSYAFWLAADPHRAQDCIDIFEANDLTCAPVGTVASDSSLMLSVDGVSAELVDLARDRVTGLWS